MNYKIELNWLNVISKDLYLQFPVNLKENNSLNLFYYICHKLFQSLQKRCPCQIFSQHMLSVCHERRWLSETTGMYHKKSSRFHNWSTLHVSVEISPSGYLCLYFKVSFFKKLMLYLVLNSSEKQQNIVYWIGSVLFIKAVVGSLMPRGDSWSMWVSILSSTLHYLFANNACWQQSANFIPC